MDYLHSYDQCNIIIAFLFLTFMYLLERQRGRVRERERESSIHWFMPEISTSAGAGQVVAKGEELCWSFTSLGWAQTLVLARGWSDFRGVLTHFQVFQYGIWASQVQVESTPQ